MALHVPKGIVVSPRILAFSVKVSETSSQGPARDPSGSLAKASGRLHSWASGIFRKPGCSEDECLVPASENFNWVFHEGQRLCDEWLKIASVEHSCWRGLKRETVFKEGHWVPSLKHLLWRPRAWFPVTSPCPEQQGHRHMAPDLWPDQGWKDL